MRLISTLLLLLSPLTLAQPADFATLLPQGSQLGLVVMNDQGKVIAEHQADTLMVPASTVKLITATAAWLTLGESFRYETELRGQVNGGAVMRGNLTLTMRGDPTLTRADLFRLIGELRRQGVKVIEGDLIIDGTVFSGYDRAKGWPWDDLGICFSAPASAYILDHGCADVRLTLRGDKVALEKPAHLPLDIDNDVRIGPETEHCPLEMSRLGANRYVLYGCTERSKALSLAIDDPRSYLQAVLRQQLLELGITLKGVVRFGTGEGDVLASHRSAPLPDLIRELLHESDNQISDSLLRTLGQKRYGQGRYALGVEASINALKPLGLDLSGAALMDGSGLSRYNLLSPRQLAELLMLWQTHPALKGLSDKLPVAGVSGTLAHRPGTRDIKGLLRGKTGTFGQVANLAGVLETPSGDQWVVVQMVNGMVGQPAQRRARLAEFESLWYQCLLSRCLPSLQESVASADNLKTQPQWNSGS
ncbi:D-alanyl-D-alanine carboxypeptidase/D-alanyl-D-alanine-endopeptidase [Ferrimonas balearica]|uniref:D-alanyl-D-alanine carboxypeptidase/D-alanyl-D-alanine endopeptidase n=1 Tax=Ferrimonas balearica TaxID=44012 RepID=UPI001C99A19C|nr:D-alanyl-D-alanine carboxypeptidase/D-alanyl-D-alanine-endopeptidase [Ferrimonas balearica]MBY5920376.1 D-alanyl-D-alanine carboxypeptidase/D-alanyl-D-alanine-endopeptidase [Ferrimonas balearica]MBY5996939.1 D-alanyl-D-alanine carboxypeptidase/D-alanyl-D-alanine-endopeptidase [Ferrimonas balearica]